MKNCLVYSKKVATIYGRGRFKKEFKIPQKAIKKKQIHEEPKKKGMMDRIKHQNHIKCMRLRHGKHTISYKIAIIYADLLAYLTLKIPPDSHINSGKRY